MDRDDTDGSGMWRDLLAAEIDRQEEAQRSLVRPWQVYAAIALMVTIGMGMVASWASREYKSLRAQQERLDEQQQRLEEQQQELEQSLDETRSALAQLENKIKGAMGKVEKNKQAIDESRNYIDEHAAKLKEDLRAFKKLDDRLRTIEERVMEDTQVSKDWLAAKLAQSLKSKRKSKSDTWFTKELNKVATAEWMYGRLEQLGSAKKPGTKKKDATEWFKGSLESNLGGKAPSAWFKGSLESNLGGKAPSEWFKGSLKSNLDGKTPGAWFNKELESNLGGKAPRAWFNKELENSLRDSKTKSILEAWVKEALEAAKPPATDPPGGDTEEGSGQGSGQGSDPNPRE